MGLVGRRRPDVKGWGFPDEVEPGDFWRFVNDDGSPLEANDLGNLTGGVWGVACPMSYGVAIGRLVCHTVREEEDGSISVRAGDGSSNSILVTGHHGEQWHGYIERGEWNPC